MRNRQIFLVFTLVGLLASTAWAQFVPPDLCPGDEYHLIFVTNGTRDATSANIADYNNFVQAQAEANPSLTGTNNGVIYNAIASTETVDARDNALIEAPVYLIDGTRVADGFADMWDDSIQDAIVIDQHLTNVGRVTVWTGTDGDGNVNATFPLGNGVNAQVLGGYSDELDQGWTEGFVTLQTFSNRMYAISEKLTVTNLGSDSVEQNQVFDSGLTLSDLNFCLGSFGIVLQADDVTLAKTTRISKVQWTGNYANDPAPPIDNFRVNIYADDGTGTQPTGSPLATFNVGNNVNRESIGIGQGMIGEVFQYTADVDFVMQAGIKYWVSPVSVDETFCIAFRIGTGQSNVSQDNGASWKNQPHQMDFRLLETSEFDTCVESENQNSCFESDVSSSQIGAEFVQLDTPTTITRVEWSGAYLGPPPTLDNFDIEIYADNNGTPVGAPLATFNADGNRTDLGNGFFDYSAEINFAMAADTPYWISIHGNGDSFCWSSQFPVVSEFAFSFDDGANWSSIPDRQCDLTLFGFDTPPPNDNWIDTNGLPVFPIMVTGTNLGASTQPDEQELGLTGSTVWWFVQAPGDGMVTIDTFGSEFNTQLHIFEYPQSGLFVDLVPLTDNNDADDTLQSEVTFAVEASQCYEIRVGGYNPNGIAAEGNIILNGTFTPDCEFDRGDLNGDGFVNLLDVAPFVTLLSDGTFQCEGDINQDGIVNLLDVDPFIALLGGG